MTLIERLRNEADWMTNAARVWSLSCDTTIMLLREAADALEAQAHLLAAGKEGA